MESAGGGGAAHEIACGGGKERGRSAAGFRPPTADEASAVAKATGGRSPASTFEPARNPPKSHSDECHLLSDIVRFALVKNVT